MIGGNNWYDLNAQRLYPIDGAASGVDDAGEGLPPALLVDCRLRYPAALGRYAYLAALTTTPGLVTALFLASDRPATSGLPASSFAPLAAVSLPRPVTPHAQYPVRAMADGVVGWVVFGDGISEPYAGRFSGPSQSQIMSRCASPYGPRPVRSVSKEFSAATLRGLVALRAGKDVELAVEPRRVELDSVVRTVQAIVFRLRTQLNRNVHATYAGDCLARPETGNCPKTPLGSINGVTPDCDGVIEIEFRGVRATPYAGGGGVLLDSDLGYSEACPGDGLPDADGNLPLAADRCCGGRGVVERDQASCSDVVYHDMTLTSLDHAFTLAGDNPFAEDFRDTPSTDYYCGGTHRPVLRAEDDGVNLLLIRPAPSLQFGGGCADPSSLDKEAKAVVRPEGSLGTAGIVVAYRADGGDGNPRYYLVLVNAATGDLEVRYFDGALLSTVAAAPAGVVPGGWYDLRVQTATYPANSPAAGKAAIAASVRAPGGGGGQASLAVVADDYGPGVGLFGIATAHGAGMFAVFALE
jgi:hypothetical protein